jgi:serine/threonine-protein phosphatase 6 regulatory ankyrin repeat subunit B
MDLVTYLIDKGLDVNVKDKFGNTVLHYGASSGSVELVKFLLDKGLDVNTKNAEGTSILHCAAESGSVELVKFLLDRGADINAKNVEGATILHYAARSGSVEVVKFLLDKGLDINARGEYTLTVLREAVCSHSEKLVDFLFNRVEPIQRNYIASYIVDNNAINIISFILSKKFIDKNKFIQELLYYASHRNNKYIVAFLISIGVNINTPIDGTTSLIEAINLGFDDEPSGDFIELLISNGADVNAIDYDGMTPLLYAAQYGYIGIVRILLESRADSTICDRDNLTPLDYAKDDVMIKYITDALEKRKKKVIFPRLQHKPAKMNLLIHYNQN